MQDFNCRRDDRTLDQLWFLEHYPVFTLGKASQEKHILDPGKIAVVKSDRGGQVTYHAPGQLIIYFLIDLIRKSLSLKQLIDVMQASVVELLQQQYHIQANYNKNMPGVYVDNAKICSIGLKINKGCTYHGLSLNINMDLTPFTYINPCGIKGLQMIQLVDLLPNSYKNLNSLVVAKQLKNLLLLKLNYTEQFIDK